MGSDKTLQYTKGTRIKFTNNSTTFYGVVSSSAFSTDTTVTLFANTDYAIANSAITTPFYSYQANPQGYPTKFNYTASATGWSSLSTNVSYFWVVGSIIYVYFDFIGTSNSASASCTLPVAPLNADGGNTFFRVADNGAGQVNPGLIDPGGTTTANLYRDNLGTSYTTSGTKRTFGQTFYAF